MMIWQSKVYMVFTLTDAKERKNGFRLIAQTSVIEFTSASSGTDSDLSIAALGCHQAARLV